MGLTLRPLFRKTSFYYFPSFFESPLSATDSWTLCPIPLLLSSLLKPFTHFINSQVESLSVDLQERVSQLPGLVRDSIEPVGDYLSQFSAFKSLDGAVRDIYQQVSRHLLFWCQANKLGARQKV